MTDTKPARYIHRVKEDATLDSICLACLTTISSKKTASELEREEEDHVCKFAFPARRATGRPQDGQPQRRKSDEQWKKMVQHDETPA